MNQSTDMFEYWHIAVRRKYWIIIPFLVTILGGLAYLVLTPKVYQAQTLILVQSQSVPQDFVRSIITDAVDERLRTITQQVTSRTNLEAIIRDYHLSGEMGQSATIDQLVDELRKRIKIDVSKGERGRATTSAFTITFRGPDPKKVMQVTNALASNFISQNLEIRESHVLGTSTFLADELESVRTRLLAKEEELKTYRERYMGGLPSQLDGNIKMIEGLQLQLERLSGSIRDRENRRSVLEGELYAAQSVSSPVKGGDERAVPEEFRDLATLKSQLAGLETKYTPSHPDVIRLKRQIESLESEEKGRAPGSKEEIRRSETPAHRRILEELRGVEMQIRNLRFEADRVTAQIRTFQKWVEDTPRREQELFSIQRDYDNLKSLYDSLLKRKLEADIAVSMEKKQKGEQFRVIDPAKIPTYPVDPDMRKVLLVILALGIGLGCGFAYVAEMMDTSYKRPEEIEKELKLPVLMSIPYRRTEQEIRSRKRKAFFKAAGVATGFAVSVVAIVVGIKGFEATLRYIREVAGL